MTNILGISGQIGAGKDTLINFLSGYFLKFYDENNEMGQFEVRDDGKLWVNMRIQTEEGGDTFKMMHNKLDLDTQDPAYLDFYQRCLWPHVKKYNFAFNLKIAVHMIFGVPLELLFGTQEDKNKPTHIKWTTLSPFCSDEKYTELFEAERLDDYVTVRELLQTFGTDICREIDDFCWCNAGIRQVQAEGSKLACLGDVRFENEIETIKNAGGKVIRLTRCSEKSSHSSEKSLAPELFDAVIDNADMTIKQQNRAILDLLLSWGWIEGKIA